MSSDLGEAPTEAPSTVAPSPTSAADRPPVTDRVVFAVAAVAAIAVVLWGLLDTDSLGAATDAALAWIVANVGWLLVLAATGFVGFAIWIAVSRYGRIPLGKDGEKPEFRTSSWIAMMFSAGMGIGLMFYGGSEPLAHFVNTPPGAQPGIGTAMATTLFHWTLHPWAIYAVVGLALAYGTYRRGRLQLISAAFAPLIGERRANGPAGRFIDILAIFATLFGSAASLGLGALQIGAGFEANGWLSNPGSGLLVAIIVLLTMGFIASAVSGVAKGIQFLANFNMVVAIVLAVFVFVVGPTVLILNLIPSGIGDYFRDLASMSARTAATAGPGANDWLGSNTIFYWAWWISWTPFVGMFIARISRGRTIKQFVIGVIAVPSAVSLVWFSIFGGAAISAYRALGGGSAEQTQAQADFAGAGPESQLFELLGGFPLAGVTSVIVMVLVAVFFVSGADAASVVLGTLSQRGTQEPKTWAVVFWGVLMGLVAVVMLLIGGSDALSGLQNLTIVAAAPFAILIVALCVSLARDLRSDPMIVAENQLARQLQQQARELRDRNRVATTESTSTD